MDFVGGAGSAFITVGIVAGLGIVAFLIVGFPLLRKISENLFSFYGPSDDSTQITPEYSIAEARVNTGRYSEAIEEYRKVIVRHPDDMYPHLRIADIALKYLQDNQTTEMELQAALTKAKGEDSVALAAGRLADLYQHTLQDPARALDVMKQLREKIPTTKQAKLAEERIVILEGIVHSGETLPESPGKIAARPSRFKLTD
ncbi:MAG TPA: tetratricopeptide repeat protein [Verrucomicrobiae bacterium]|nr:tetratricopeptide repeat protein [Verrucomicrobiae bacterium]